MMKKYIFGITPLAEMIGSYMMENGEKEFCGYIADRKYITDDVEVSPCIAWEDFIETVDPQTCEIIIAIGYYDMNHRRQAVFDKIKRSGYSIGNYIHPTAIISSKAIIGVGNIFFENVIVQPFVRIGDGNIFWSSASICHNTDIGNYNYFACSAVVLGKVKIENNCFIGANATIRNKICMANETLIGANTFVNKNTERGNVIVPSSAITLSKRSSEIENIKI